MIELKGNDFILFCAKGKDLLLVVYDKSTFEELKKYGKEYSKNFLG